MFHIDYMKIARFLADTLEANKEITVKNHDNNMGHLDIFMTGSSVDEKMCSILLGKFETVLTFAKSYMTADKFSKWINSLEYYLEQEFKKNIKIDSETSGDIYKIIIRH